MWPFKKKIEVKVGQIWLWDRQIDNPFGCWSIQILEIRGNWAKYKYSSGGINTYRLSEIRMLFTLKEDS